jgi:hypothetical protein
MSGYEPSILYIRILSHRTGAMPNFGECGFYDVGRIDAARRRYQKAPSESRESTETAPEEAERAEPSPAAGGGEEGARRSWWSRVFGG